MVTDRINEGTKLPSSRPVIIHLVHGTWPKGILHHLLHRTRLYDRLLGLRGHSAPIWIEQGSEFREFLVRESGNTVVVHDFTWSGSNSHTARSVAAIRFRRHLSQAIDSNGDSRHIVVAHSHGGTVAAMALSGPDPEHIHDSIGALICLATPFVFLTRSSGQESVFRASLAVLILGLVSIGSLAGWYSLTILGGRWVLIKAFALFVLATTSLRLVLSKLPSEDRVGKMSINRKIPVVLLRATRDEASLAIGVAQSLNTVMNLLFRRLFEGANGSGKAAFALTGVVLATTLGRAALVLMSGHLSRPIAEDELFYIRWTVACGLVGFGYLVSHTILALATGVRNPRLWFNYIIDVEATPPNGECTIKTYDQTMGMRHKVYDLPQARHAVLGVALGLTAGGKIRPLRLELMEAASRSRRERTRWHGIGED